jgi:hypothetical protein
LALLPNVQGTPNSRQVLARFGVRLLLLIVFSSLASVELTRSLAALLWMSIILCALVGLIRRETLFGPVLNHWDESVAFGALFALVHILSHAPAV